MQADFVFIPELTPVPIPHIANVFSSYSERLILRSREIPDVISALDRRWFSLYCATHRMSGDFEFSRSTSFMVNLKYFHVKLEPLPARLHNKNGTVQAKHEILRRVVRRLNGCLISCGSSI